MDKLFPKSREKICMYCRHGRRLLVADDVLCPYHGAVVCSHTCSKFIYDPILRQPRITPELPKYSEEDFKL